MTLPEPDRTDIDVSLPNAADVPTSGSTPPAPTHDELVQHLERYSPTGLSEAQWRPVAVAAIPLILGTGTPVKLRVSLDAEVIASVTRYLISVGVVPTLDLILADSTVLSYDQASRARGLGAGSVRNHRGKLHRLQAAYRGLPWQDTRRAAGVRATEMHSPDFLHRVLELTAVAAGNSDEPGAQDLVDAVAAARVRRAGGTPPWDVPEKAAWSRATRYAAREGLKLTRWSLVAGGGYDPRDPPAPRGPGPVGTRAPPDTPRSRARRDPCRVPAGARRRHARTAAWAVSAVWCRLRTTKRSPQSLTRAGTAGTSQGETR